MSNRLAERIHSSIDALQGIEDTRDKDTGYANMTVVLEGDATAFLKEVQQDNLGFPDSNALSKFRTRYASLGLQEAMEDFSKRLNHDLEGLAAMFTQSFINLFPQETAAAGQEITEAVREELSRVANMFYGSMTGALQNALATISGLALVAFEKIPKPELDANDSEWEEYKKSCSALLHNNTDLLVEIGQFHFEVQLVFHNLQKIQKRSEHYVYPFNPNRFSIETSSEDCKKDARLCLIEATIEEIIEVSNNPESEVVDDNETRTIDFDGPAKGCPVLKLTTEYGNFYIEFCRWVHKVIEEVFVPNLKQHALNVR